MLNDISELIEKESFFIEPLYWEINKSIIGQKKVIDKIIIGILSGGHILLEGMPGLAKTLALKSLAKAFSGKFNRAQFTPDLLPSDLIGGSIYSQKNESFTVRKGPIFTNFLLADEINRAPAKTQSALLEAMQEKQATIGDNTYNLEEPFFVLATQNPIEQEGVYILPEAQIDRFIMKIIVGYPDKAEELEIMRKNSINESNEIKPIADCAAIVRAQKAVRAIYIDEKVEKYIIDIVSATRNPENYNLQDLKSLIEYGASPRGSISLALVSKAKAFLKRRPYVSPEDVRELAFDVLRHRIGMSYEAEAEGIKSDDIIKSILSKLPTP